MSRRKAFRMSHILFIARRPVSSSTTLFHQLAAQPKPESFYMNVLFIQYDCTTFLCLYDFLTMFFSCPMISHHTSCLANQSCNNISYGSERLLITFRWLITIYNPLYFLAFCDPTERKSFRFLLVTCNLLQGCN